MGELELMKFSIVYGFIDGVQQQRIYVDPVTRRLSQELQVGNDFIYDVTLSLGQELDRINLWFDIYGSTQVGTQGTMPDFYFEAWVALQSSNFTVAEF